MRKLFYILFMLLSGINGLLLWQNREEETGAKYVCCVSSGKINIRTDNVKSSLLPGRLALIH